MPETVGFIGLGIMGAPDGPQPHRGGPRARRPQPQRRAGRRSSWRQGAERAVEPARGGASARRRDHRCCPTRPRSRPSSLGEDGVLAGASDGDLLDRHEHDPPDRVDRRRAGRRRARRQRARRPGQRRRRRRAARARCRSWSAARRPTSSARSRSSRCSARRSSTSARHGAGQVVKACNQVVVGDQHRGRQRGARARLEGGRATRRRSSTCWAAGWRPTGSWS